MAKIKMDHPLVSGKRKPTRRSALEVETANELETVSKELEFQSSEKELRTAELASANRELVFQNGEKEKRAAELIIANKQLVFQNGEKEKRAAELIIANKELVFQNGEKEKRAAELVIANEELIFQNGEKENRAAELIIANEELVFQNEEKEKRAAELDLANKELKLAEQQFRLVVESAPHAMVLVDVDGRITLVNNQTETLFGYRRGELVGNNVAMLVPELLIHLQPGYMRMISKGTPDLSDVDLLGKRKSDIEFPVEIGLSPIDSSEGSLILASIIDMTEKRIQEENRLKINFLANMSHELRTPLNAVLGFSELLIEKKVGDLNVKQLEYLNDVHASGSHLLRLINNVLDIAQIEAGHAELVIESFSVTEVIEGVIHVLSVLAGKKQIQINKKFTPELDMISMDKNKFRQILYNLLSNAIKFSFAGGVVDVETTIRDDRLFVLTVKDAGIGIAKENLKKLFIPFVQLDSGISRQYQGSGLGLALTRNIVELHHGEVTVESTLGKGSTFLVLLPINFKETLSDK